MAKNLKLNIKNTQIAEAVNLSGLKSKLAKKKSEAVEAAEGSEETAAKKSPQIKEATSKSTKTEKEDLPKDEAPRIRARSKSAFVESYTTEPHAIKEREIEEEHASAIESTKEAVQLVQKEEQTRMKTSAEIRKEIFGEEDMGTREPIKASILDTSATVKEVPPGLIKKTEKELTSKEVGPTTPPNALQREAPTMQSEKIKPKALAPADRLGPTGRHIKDYIKPKAPAPVPPMSQTRKAHPPHSHQKPSPSQASSPSKEQETSKEKFKPKLFKEAGVEPKSTEEEGVKKSAKPAKFKEFRDVKPAKKTDSTRQFDARDRQGLRASEEEQWRKRRPKSQMRQQQEEIVIRPTSLSVRTPISIKDLASEMKLKASQLIGKLFLQGVVVTLNDMLEDETSIQLLGQEFGCQIHIDTSEEKRIQITDKSIKEELQQIPQEQLQIRPPIVTFMGHVDHGKTSLIDAIRKSNRASGEAGAITQHIGAFRCSTSVGDITVLDTPGHEAFSAMRARGADVTDIVVLVVAGDEGIRQQTIEAIQHAKNAKVTIVVAINKSDKPNFNPETVYRQLAEQDLLPEAWGGQTITVNCSAVTGQGIQELLDMLAIQAEVMELKANPDTRARGSVLESEMHKGMGAVATVLVQNGTLRRGDALVFAQHWGRVKTMHDEHGRELQEAKPSSPVEITGLSGLPEAGQEFIVVKNEKEAREIAEARTEGMRQSHLLLQQKKKVSMENLFQQASDSVKKILNIVLRADVQGSLEALKVALLKIQSDKVDLNVIFAGVGEISESDVQLAATSKAVVIGFHTQVESHAELLVKQLGVQVRLHEIIYHAIDDVKLLMSGLLDRIAQETEKGKVLVKATFKSSQMGMIAGCQVIEGSIHRNNHVRVRRGNDVIWKGTISSLKRVKEDVREVQKGLECGIVLNGFSEYQENDILEAYEITYIAQQL